MSAVHILTNPATVTFPVKRITLVQRGLSPVMPYRNALHYSLQSFTGIAFSGVA